MQGAGNYDTRLIWLKPRTPPVRDPQTNQLLEIFDRSAVFWVSLKSLTAAERLAYGARESQADVEIRLRYHAPTGEPAVESAHGWEDQATGDLYEIDGRYFDDDELVCLAHARPDRGQWQVEGVIED